MPGQLAPTDKVTAVGIGGAASALVVWVLDAFVHVPIPSWLAAAVTLLVTAGAGYLRKERNPVDDPPTVD